MRTFRTVTIAFVAIVSMLSFGWASGLGQEATPTPEPGAAMGVEYPVAIHEGTCEMPTAEPLFDLNSTTVVGSDNAEAELVGEMPGPPALISTGTVDLPLTDIASAPHVVALHESADAYDTLVACGTIAGTVDEGTLVITLQPVMDSGVNGVAIFTEDGESTNVQIYVISPDAMPATPGA